MPRSERRLRCKRGEEGGKKWSLTQGEPAASVGWTMGEADQTIDGIAGREVCRQTPGAGGRWGRGSGLDTEEGAGDVFP